MQVILSIKPVFANQIFEGTKKFEFRRVLFDQSKVDSIIVYSSSPMQKVIGEFVIERVIYAELPTLWLLTKASAGITQADFYKYFKGKVKGYAIGIIHPVLYYTPLKLKEVFGISPPQSFAYWPPSANRVTSYPVGTVLELVKDAPKGFELSQSVEVINFDKYRYLVSNRPDIIQDLRFCWVCDYQLKQITV